MSILEMVDILLEDKLNRGYSDSIDIRFTREQAKELYEAIHRIITYDKNMEKQPIIYINGDMTANNINGAMSLDNYGSYT